MNIELLKAVIIQKWQNVPISVTNIESLQFLKISLEMDLKIIEAAEKNIKEKDEGEKEDGGIDEDLSLCPKLEVIETLKNLLKEILKHNFSSDPIVGLHPKLRAEIEIILANLEY